jgi:hypothetical protein
MTTTNQFLYVDFVGRNVLARLVNSLGLTHTANRDYEGDFGSENAYKIGSTVRIRKPVYFTVTSGAALAVQAVVENQTYLTIQFQQHVDVAFTSVETQRFLQDPETNIYEGAAQALANILDTQIGIAGTLEFNRAVGTPGAGVTSFAVPNMAITTQRKYGVRQSAYMAFHPDPAGTLRASLQNSFNEAFNKDVSQRAIIGSLGSHDLLEDQNLQIHTTGTFPGTPNVATAVVDGSSTVNLTGFTASQSNVLNAGDIITFANVFGVNPQNRSQVGYGSENLAQFNVQSVVNSDASGNAVVTILPPIILTGPYQNVTNAPALNAAVSCSGITTPGTATQYIKNFVYSREAFTLACVPGPISSGAAYSKVFTDEDSNISMRVNIVYDIQTDQDVMRIDIFYGTKAFGPYGTMILS